MGAIRQHERVRVPDGILYRQEGKQNRGNVVTRLTRDLVGQNFCVYMDSFFTSVPLFQDLLDDNIYVMGTLRRDRKGFPQDLTVATKKGLPSPGDVVTQQSGSLVVCLAGHKASHGPFFPAQHQRHHHRGMEKDQWAVEYCFLAHRPL